MFLTDVLFFFVKDVETRCVLASILPRRTCSLHFCVNSNSSDFYSRVVQVHPSAGLFVIFLCPSG